MFRFLFGPMAAGERARLLGQSHQGGQCLTFGSADADLVVRPGDSWASIAAKLNGWQPDAVVVRPAYHTIPIGIWDAPAPVIALAIDWNLTFHALVPILQRCDLVLTDSL